MSADHDELRAQWKVYRENRQHKAHAEGLCSRCVRTPPAPGRKMCVVCAEDHREIFDQRKQVANTIGHCVVCTKRRCVPGKMKCRRCAKVTATYCYQRRLAAKAQGLCQACFKAQSADGKLSCQSCIDRIGARNLARKKQFACKVKDGDRSINKSVTHKHGDTNHGKSTKEVRSQRVESNQGHQSQARCQGEGRAEGQSQGQLGHGPNVLGLHQERSQLAHLRKGALTVAVFAVTFGLLVAGMLR